MGTNKDYSTQAEPAQEQVSGAEQEVAEAAGVDSGSPHGEQGQQNQGDPSAAPAPDQGTADNEAADNGVVVLQKRVAALAEENSELKDKYLRKHADFENFRKRMLREKEDFAKYANQQILGDLVTVIDDFERAIGSTRESQDFQAFHDGIVMIEKQLVGMLENKYGLQRFESVGEEFDPQRHEAVASAPAEEGQDVPKVAEVFQKGYMLHDRVLRSAKVKVSTPSS